MLENSYAAKETVILIPSLNPDEKLVKYVDELIGLGFDKILVVNDGSRKDCDNIFSRISQIKEVVVIEHKVNCGKGRALKTGFSYILKHYDDCVGVVTADSDGQHSPKDTLKVAGALCENKDSIILGTRDFNEEQVPFKSRYGNKITTVVFWLLYGKYINDTQTGLRGIGIQYLEKLCGLKGERFEYEIRMLIYGAKSGIELKEVTIETIYIDDNRETHFDPVRDSIKIYKILFASFFLYLLSSLSSFLIDMSVFSLLNVFILKGLTRGTNIFLSTAFARIISSIYNFTVNHKVVFKSDSNMIRTAIGYYTLVVVQMCCSAGLVYLLTNVVTIPAVIAKVVVDTVLFFVSYQIQQRYIFK